MKGKKISIYYQAKKQQQQKKILEMCDLFVVFRVTRLSPTFSRMRRPARALIVQLVISAVVIDNPPLGEGVGNTSHPALATLVLAHAPCGPALLGGSARGSD